ncbi:hypothetical protein HYDPIDRAFT_37012 [Hydnomerulius pinastri MD-312]|nr:hypothetical protein HYDPIDRAFT_37012 [Hydnomerulius pinastri MD-312]
MGPSQYLNALRRGRPALPISSSAVREKMDNDSKKGSWLLPMSISLPGAPTRRVRLRILSPVRVPRLRISRFGYRRGLFSRCCAFLGGLLAICIVVILLGTEEAHWSPTFRDTTLVFSRENLQKIWRWEIDSGHYPSNGKIPEQIGFISAILNPALPPAKAHTLVSPFTPPSGPVTTTARGVGPRRTYHINQNLTDDIVTTAYPPRPISGSAADLDIIVDRCSYSNGKFVRDCLEFLRVGAGLDNGRRVRRGGLDEFKYIYTEEELSGEQPLYSSQTILPPVPAVYPTGRYSPNAGLQKKRGAAWETSLSLPPPRKPTVHSSLTAPCDPENPRLFHMYWAGPFDDKPYTSLLSFLFTQNLGLHLQDTHELTACRPQFWVWINPFPAAATLSPSALTDMYQSLKTNPWAAPFLHPRFKGIIKFKLWNTTEQLDNIPELHNDWRMMQSLFNSGGVSVSVPAPNPSASSSSSTSEDDMANRLGSKSETSYDRLSVIMSDMARFIVTHRFGGIYLDADTLFLRDWEEMWGWKGAFAYRWSYHDFYNTAVLHLNKGSALGSFLFRTALKNGFDFHPGSITRYLREAHLSALLTQLPDALFDPAWLNAEGLQLERPPHPFFTSFADFFGTQAQHGAAPQATGFDGFFKGAFSYHFHNSWWKPFDPARNWPDLGPQFAEGERAARAAANPNADPDNWIDKISDDKVDLDWSTVLKRTFESYIRGESPNMYGEWLRW